MLVSLLLFYLDCKYLISLVFILQTNLETYNKKAQRVSCRSLACNYKSYVMYDNILIKQTGKKIYCYQCYNAYSILLLFYKKGYNTNQNVLTRYH